MRWTRASLGAAAGIAAVAAHDVLQRRHAILRKLPVVGHARYAIERIGPELRQYVVAGNDEERPFSRDQRRWVYVSAKRENNDFRLRHRQRRRAHRRVRDRQAPHVRPDRGSER